MWKASLEQRVEIIERKVDELQQLPARIDTLTSRVDTLTSEFLQSREEVRVEFIATRAEIQAGDEETRRFMRVLHEDVISRIALIQEGRRSRKKS